MKSWLLILFLVLFSSGCQSEPVPLTLTPVTPAVEATPASTATPAARPTATLSPTSTPARTPTPSTTTLILWENLPQVQRDQLDQAIADFSGLYPNYRLEVQHYDQPDTLVAAIIEERVDYDLLLGPATLLAPLRQADKLQAMDDLFPASYLDAFASSTLTGASQGGRLWGLPDTAGFHLLLFYNRDFIEQPPATTDDLVDLAQGLTTGSEWGLVLNSRDPLWVVPWLWAYEGWLVDGDGTPTLNSEAMIQALTLVLSWQVGDSPIAPIASRVEAQELFTTGKAAMMIDGDWAIDELTQDSQIPWGVATLPQVANADQPPGPLVLGRYWAVSRAASGQRTEGAIAFLEFMALPDQQLNWTRSFGLLPSRREALNNPLILTDPALHVSATQLQAGRGVPLNVNPNRLLDAMRTPLEQMLIGDLTPTEAAAAMQANLP